jgi:hypothetical protein
METLFKSVFGVFHHKEEARAAVNRLTRAGFSSGNIVVLFPDNKESRQFARENATLAPTDTQTGPNANVDVVGDLGISQPIRGPVGGALPGALREMRVPEDDAAAYGERQFSLFVVRHRRVSNYFP